MRLLLVHFREIHFKDLGIIYIIQRPTKFITAVVSHQQVCMVTLREPLMVAKYSLLMLVDYTPVFQSE